MKFVKFLFPVAAFASGFYLTQRAFETGSIPFPHEIFSAVVGLGLACWAMGIVSLFGPKKKESPK